MNFYVFVQRTIFITGFITCIIAFLSQASFASPLTQEASSASICAIALQPGMTSSIQEVKDIIDVAKVISFLRGNKDHSRSPNGNIIIHPIDILLASMTIVVEVDNDQTHVVKANLTTGIIFNSLKSLREGRLLFDLQNRVWEELNDPIKKRLSILESHENGYILALDRRYTNSFDNIISQDAIFNQGALDLLRIETEGNGNTYIDPRDLLLAMIQSPDLYFVYELFSSQLTGVLSFFESWLVDNQRQIDEIRSIMSNSTNTPHRYTPILQLQISYYMSRRRQNNGNKEVQSVNTNAHLLRKFGFPGRAVERSMDQITDNKFDNLKIRIKRRILRNTSSNEVREIEDLNNNEIDALVNENDIRNFLKYHRDFTDEEVELFMQSFIQKQETIEPETNNTINNDTTTIQIPQPRQQLIERLSRMNQDDLEIFIREVGFEVNSDFIHPLMDPQKIPKDIKDIFIRFIADVSQAGSIFDIRTSNNAYQFKKIRSFSKRNKKHQRSSTNYHSLHLGWNWVLVVREEGNIFILDRIISHGTYERYY